MTAEEELCNIIENQLSTDATLVALTASNPHTVYYWRADDSPEWPYITYKLKNQRTKDQVFYDATLEINLWFYNAFVDIVSQVENQIVIMFNRKILESGNLSNCRIWHDSTDRKDTQKKDSINDSDVVNFNMLFSVRFIALDKANATIYP